MRRTAAPAAKHELTEPEAIRRAQDGDATAFEYLYNCHSRRVYSLCLRMIRNTAEAEDLTQQAFLQVFRKIGTFRGDSVFSTWLHRLTVNIVLMHLHRKTPKEVLFDGSDQPGTNDNEPRELGSGDTSMLGTIDRLNLMRAIRQLPVGCKRLFLLHDVMGYRHTEIAELLRCSVGCSKSQVHKARKRLRRLLLGITSQREPVGSGSRP